MSVCHKHSVIGVLDSGVGGLTVASEIIRQLPKESIYYIGDNERCPYGPRSVEEVQSFVFEMVEFLKQFPLKALVVACNTVCNRRIDCAARSTVYSGYWRYTSGSKSGN